MGDFHPALLEQAVLIDLIPFLLVCIGEGLVRKDGFQLQGGGFESLHSPSALKSDELLKTFVFVVFCHADVHIKHMNAVTKMCGCGYV